MLISANKQLITTALKLVQYQLPAISQLQSACTKTNNTTEQYTLQKLTARNFSVVQKCAYCTSSADAMKALQEQPREQTKEGILKRVLNKVGLAPNSKTRMRVASHILYESVADKINYTQFFEDFHLSNTFNSWFLVTELHVWMLMVRAMAEGADTGEDGRFLRNCIVEVMWSDVNKRAKKLGANNPSKTRQQIEVLSEQFQAALIAYDEGIMSSDTVLAAALWRRFFEMNCDDYLRIERLVKYVRLQMLMLDQIDRNDLLLKSKIAWSDITSVKVP